MTLFTKFMLIAWLLVLADDVFHWTDYIEEKKTKLAIQIFLQSVVIVTIVCVILLVCDFNVFFRTS